MLNFLHSWIEQIVIAVIIVSIFEMILPNNKTKKYIKMVLGLFIVFNMISPFVNKSELYKFKVDDVINEYSPQSIKTSSNTKNEKIEEIYIKEMEKDISSKVKNQGYTVKSCKIDAVIYSENNKAGINEIEIILNGKLDENKGNNEDEINSKIETVEKVEIDIGKKEENVKISEKEIKKLKKFLSNYYEVDKDIINIILEGGK